MKLLFFDDYTLGVLKGDMVVDVSDAVHDVPHLQPQDLIRGVIERWAELKGSIEQAADRGQGVPAAKVRFRAPLPRPSTIACMAVNYMENGTLPERPPINAFLKSPNAVIGDGDTLVLPDVPATIFDPESEMACVIGKRASNVPEAEAMSYIFGYMNFIDGSARGLPPSGNTFYQMKSRDTFAPMGPYIVTADEMPNAQNVQVRCWINGRLTQDYNTSDMAHHIERCVSWVSSIHALDPGDVLAFGTNHRGLSAYQDGDQVEIETKGLGRLHVRVRDDLKRTWGRETRLERAEQGLKGPAPQLTGKYAPEK
ncbi:MAG: hypothetical protein QOF51_2052 [Chloroflexota bacterium]|nr:hypothetical protein [Chloroflexota bacterium]